MSELRGTTCWVVLNGPNAGCIVGPVIGTERPVWLTEENSHLADGTVVSSRAYPDLARIMRRRRYPFGRSSRYRFSLPDTRGRVLTSINGADHIEANP